MKKLTPKQEAFVREYLISFNGADAARKAGYKGNDDTLKQVAAENLAKPYISDRITQHQQAAQQKFEIKQEDILRELALVAFGRLPEVVDEDGNIIDEEKGAFLASVSRSTSSASSSEGSSESKSFSYSTQNKVKALELLGKHTGLWGKLHANEGNNSVGGDDALRRVGEIIRKRGNR